MNHPTPEARRALAPALAARIVDDGADRAKWLEARVGKIGGSDAAGFAKLASVPIYVRQKLHNPFNGNAYTAHGTDRERAILAQFHVQQNRALFAAVGNPLHVCTPDGVVVAADGEVIPVQVKTSTKPFPKLIPAAYRRQLWWEQWVMGARRSLFVWEQHDGAFSPVEMEPTSIIFDRDDDAIAELVTIADLVLDGIHAAEQFRKELQA